MKMVFRLVLVGLVIALAFWARSVFFPSPQAEIQRRLLKVAQLVSFGANEGNIARVAAVQQLGNFFAETLEVQLDDPRLQNHTFSRREELLQAALAARTAIASLQVKFLDINVNLGPEPDTATADLTLAAKLSTETDQIFQQLRFTLRKVEAKWVINRITATKTLTP